ncbi:MAG: phosphatase PAP2 family protein [Acidobacteria bacterium]|nr:phosphatase PAP2 family protein [Acidobacteriota bacterium]
MRVAFLVRRVSLVAVLSATCPVLAEAQANDAALTPPATSESDTVDEPCDKHGISTVVRCVFHDLGQFTRGRSRVVLGAGASLTLVSLLLDDRIAQAWRDDDQDGAVDLAEHLGEGGLHSGIPAAVYLIAKATDQTEAAELSVTLIRAHVVSSVVTRSLKLLPRPRPYQHAATPTKGSFPSGHTSATFATATVLQRRWGWRAGVPAFTMATYVAASRLQNLHYLSDVVFGATIGIASGLSVDLPGLPGRVSPLVRPGAVGFSLDLSGSLKP